MVAAMRMGLRPMPVGQRAAQRDDSGEAGVETDGLRHKSVGKRHAELAFGKSRRVDQHDVVGNGAADDEAKSYPEAAPVLGE